jgi:phosphatidylglycerophosphate synthase
VTVAVVLPATGPAEPDLAAQLRRAGVTEVRADPGGDAADQLRRIAALARESRTPVLLCAADVVAHTSALLTVVTEPGGGTVALTGVHAGADGRYAEVREERGLVAGAGAAGLPGASGAFLGVLRVCVADLPALAESADRLAESPDRLAEGVDRPASAGVVDLLLPELVRAGRRVGACRVRLLVADRATDEAEAAAVRARMAAVDEDAARLRLAIKERDDFFTTYFVNPVSPRVVKWAARAGLTPTAVTAISVALAVVAALAFAWGARPAMVAGAVLLYVSFVLDCVDGQLARYTRRFSPIGGWLDTMADRSKEYLVYAGLAVGAERVGLGPAWPLAVAAIVLQTVRHMTDAWYGALHDEAAARRKPGETGGVGGALGRASERVQADTGSVAYWLKRIVVFPIGERWALIALAAALFGGRVALLAVLVWGGLAAAYTLALRSLRARSMRVPVLNTVDTAWHRDDGPLARLLGWAAARAGSALPPLPLAALAAAASAGLVVAAATAGREPAVGAPLVVAAAAAVVALAGLPCAAPHTGALDWLVPAALRATEYLFVVGAATAAGVPLPLLFALLFALALRHYDLVARMEKRAGAAVTRAWDIGWDGRVTVLAVGVAAGVATPTVAVLAGYVSFMFCLGVRGFWTGR